MNDHQLRLKAGILSNLKDEYGPLNNLDTLAVVLDELCHHYDRAEEGARSWHMERGEFEAVLDAIESELESRMDELWVWEAKI